ncbi:hypothetical protein FHU33_3304 [Blastococcus colisei]|uniref:Uncharacterized protein n=1 Tax=Blastococcus colisei TaxID=1564162 RepID=A0A543PIC7_9ACTN|nr:hypothetical protein [Blastococcus colisei]TQN43836.1 hypothetical protein FHU33_3304 [Blastococcus colisei]
MTPPPGPYGAPYGQPVPYGPPTPQNQPGPYGPPPQPPRTNLLPWLIIGGAVLLSGIGIALVLLFTGRDSGNENPAAAQSSSSAPAASSPADASEEPARGDLPGGAQMAEPTAVAANAFPGSDEVALAWVDALADGQWQTAFDLSCTEVQDASISAAAGGDPAYELGRYFYTQVLGGVGFTEGTFDSIRYDELTGADVGTFTLAMENGETFTLLVYVTDDLTVCDFF